MVANKKKNNKPILVTLLVILSLAFVSVCGLITYELGFLDGIFGTKTSSSDDDDETDETGTDRHNSDDPDAFSLDSIQVGEIPSQYYTGSEIRPVINISYGDEVFTEGEDYTVEFTDNVYPGVATMNIVGTGDVTGSITLNFNIIYGVDFLDNEANRNAINYVTGLYVNAYGRNPSSNELYNDLSALSAGSISAENYVLGFFQNDEFNTMISNLSVPEGSTMSLDEYVLYYEVQNCIYLGVLGRTADEAGAEHWGGVVAEQGVTGAVSALLTDANVIAQINSFVAIEG